MAEGNEDLGIPANTNHNQNTALHHYPHSNSRGPQGDALRQIYALLMSLCSVTLCFSQLMCVFVRASSLLDKAEQQLLYCLIYKANALWFKLYNICILPTVYNFCLST